MTDKLAKKDIDALTIPGLEGMVTTTRPEGRDEGTLGSEGIGKDDIMLPRLALAQKTSDEIDPTKPGKYIEGLQFTDLFNSVTRKAMGKGPLYFSILRRDNPRYVEFRDLELGGGIIDPNVPPGDPRTQFGPPDATGKSEPPKATKFYDFVILLLNDLDLKDPMQNIVGLSFKSTGLKVAKQLNLYITQRGQKALYKGVYELRTGSDSNAMGAFAIYKVRNAGWLASGSIIEALAAEAWESWKDREVKIDRDGAQTREPGDEDFPPSEM